MGALKIVLITPTQVLSPERARREVRGAGPPSTGPAPPFIG
jgi:hypothetical protein